MLSQKLSVPSYGMLMLPLSTVRAGSGVFKKALRPKNKPKTMAMTRVMATAVLKCSLFQSFF